MAKPLTTTTPTDPEWPRSTPPSLQTLNSPRQHPMNVAPLGDREALCSRYHIDDPPSSLQHTILKQSPPPPPTFHSHHPIPPIINFPALRSYPKPRPPTTAKTTGGMGQCYQNLHASTSQINWKNSIFIKQHPAIHSYGVVTSTTLSTTPHP